MTNQEILEKAIQKAIAGGWSFAITDNGYRPIHSWGVSESLNIIWYLDKNSPQTPINIYQLIFSHDFAKALWGECTQWVKSAHGTLPRTPLNGYQFHIQQMVIDDDPIKYLGANI